MRFLAGQFLLLEHDQSVNVSLSDAWLYYCGSEPAFDPDGMNAVGIHVPGRTENERSMLISRAASLEAAHHAAHLIELKYGLERVRLVSRLCPQDMGDWTPDMEQRPYDLAAVTVWPEEPEHPVRDSVILELADNPGHYIHRARRDRQAVWTVPAERVAEALCLPFPEAAEAWIRVNAREDGPLTMRYRSAALAAEDQSGADRQTQTGGHQQTLFDAESSC
jgi:hypothetical protein